MSIGSIWAVKPFIAQENQLRTEDDECAKGSPGFVGGF